MGLMIPTIGQKKMMMAFTIIKSEETAAHKKSGHTARTKQRAESRVAPMRFVCIDGEGVTENGIHRYVLIGCGKQQISNPDGLSWSEIFTFLYSQFTTGGVAFTGFFLTYDFTQWLRSLPEYKARRLLSPVERARRKRRLGHGNTNLEGEIYFPVDLAGWEFDILGFKRMKIRPKGESRWMYICDTGPFFQKSFLRVIDPKEWNEPIVTPEEFETVKIGKANRSDAVLDSDMEYYNSLENEILARVLTQLDEGFRGLGIHLSPKQWFGPGQAAQEWLSQQDTITAKELSQIVPTAFLEPARMSYFGGWFEIFAHGHIPGDTWEYDINSAYPYIIANLPCLRHGFYESGSGNPPEMGMPYRYTLVHARVWTSKAKTISSANRHYVGSMLHRDDHGNITRPKYTEGWYWWDELQAAISAGSIKPNFECMEWRSYVPCDCEPPFRGVSDIYDTRQRVGKNTPLGIACKLVPNSLYGKFAQSVGTPKFGNPIYASLVTSGCRTMILNAIGTHPEGRKDVVMVATDGVYFRSPHPTLSISKNLGDWEGKAKPNLCLFKPGVYWDDKAREAIASGEPPVFKARGVSANDLGSRIAEIDARFERIRDKRIVPEASEFAALSEWPSVRFEVSFKMISALQALQRSDWSLAGTLVTGEAAKVVQSSDPSNKREYAYWDGDILRSEPYRNEDHEPSIPYQKRFGMEDPWSEESIQSFGISPDGPIGMLIREALTDEAATNPSD